ncbi:MAG: hypothetical protein JW881_04565 [Spirochaetales bacterium]|nr:hypothetical protein [Spirochaetales bacterium]
MYSHKYNLIIGFHGCDETIRDNVVKGQVCLDKSQNDYDWLGHGIYFWENDEDRAYEWAKFLHENPRKNKPKIRKPSVIGAVIDLGVCLDLMNTRNLELLKLSYQELKKVMHKANKPLPENFKTLKNNKDLLLRKLDCAVIEFMHSAISEKYNYDSVRGTFWEGEDLYPNAGFKERNHIQICIRNPNCIKGFFIPRNKDNKYSLP